MLLELTSLAIRFPEIVMVKSKISVIVLGEMVLVCRQVRRIHNDLVTQVKSRSGDLILFLNCPKDSGRSYYGSVVFIQGRAHSRPMRDQRDQWIRAEHKLLTAIIFQVILIA